MKVPQYISHVRQDECGQLAFQSNEEHLQGVASLAGTFASRIGLGDFGHIIGQLHDMGKEKEAFQNYIRYESGIVTERHYTAESKAHAYVGGLLATALLPRYASLIVNPIMGHHRGLYDYTDLEVEMQRELPAEVSRPDVAEPSLPTWFAPGRLQPQDIHHVVRILYSCLVDADFLDTERFMLPHQYALRGGKATLEQLLPRLEAHLARFGQPQSQVNKIRSQVQQVCRQRAVDSPGFYSLTVPTGGGKTLSSLVWAMHHAVCHGLQRIIIAIPYTSIIVQTAAILRDIFGEENVLEHHSNVSVGEQADGELHQRRCLATENWDYPIIVTTNVQLFESLMSSHSSHCRKLHNICHSVLILDEVQTLPTDFLQPIVDTLDTYQRLFGVSVLFTTASQPVLQGKHMGTNPRAGFAGLSHIAEIIPAEWNLHVRLRRVELDIDDTPRTYDEIAARLAQQRRVLCIVNTRRDARELYERLPDEGTRIHLSRMMCPAHISEQIQRLKEALDQPEDTIVRVISTQLIEAGVDIDFPVVFRQEAGLDSLLQAAGRCNREGRLPLCTAHVFSLAHEHALPRGYITQCNNARLNVSRGQDWFAPDVMYEYFRQLYSRIPSFDREDIKHYLYEPQSLMLETAASHFRLIDEDTTAVIVNWRDSMSLVERLRSQGPSYTLVKKLSQYSVNLRKHDFEEMRRQGIVEEVLEGYYVAPVPHQYTDAVGLSTDNRWLEETYII